MRVALVHDYIKEYGGAERVLEALHAIFPKAPVYTSIYAPSYLGPHRKRFEGWDIRTTFLQNIPFAEKLISPLRLLASFAFKSLDLSSYDLIIVSQTGAYFPNFVKKGSTRLICYTHTPPRYLYGYKTAREVKGVMKAVSYILNHVLRMADFDASRNVDQFIANSEEVKARIEKFYRKKAIVVYPPAIDEIRSKKHEAKEEKERMYYLAGGRLARAKGVDIIIDAFISLGLPLKVFGKSFAGYGEDLKNKIANSKQIELLGEVKEDDKFELMRGAKAFVFASYDEDFGITPVEAMSVGTPVIAYNSGGVKETVIDGTTGLLYEPNTPEALMKAIKQFEKLKIDPKNCIKQAEKFSKKIFEEGIRKVMEKYARVARS